MTAEVAVRGLYHNCAQHVFKQVDSSSTEEACCTALFGGQFSDTEVALQAIEIAHICPGI